MNRKRTRREKAEVKEEDDEIEEVRESRSFQSFPIPEMVMTKSLLSKMAREIVSFPMNNRVFP